MNILIKLHLQELKCINKYEIEYNKRGKAIRLRLLL